MGCVIRYPGSFVICPKHLKTKNGSIQSGTGTILQIECKLVVADVEKKKLTAPRSFADLQKFVFWLSI